MSFDDYAESEFCECGTTLMGDPDERDGFCGVCAGAPHHRECPCDACEEYWREICRRSEIAAEAFNKRLICSCGWTGAYPEHHRDRQPTCEINLREIGPVEQASTSSSADSTPAGFRAKEQHRDR